MKAMSIRAACRMLLAAVLSTLFALPASAAPPFLLRQISSSTIPANGDLNPYGVAFVPKGFPSGGVISAGDVLVSNFNNGNNQQGIGTTIIQLRPSGSLAPPPAPGTTAGDAAVFFTSVPTGLSTALGVLRAGFVVVGNLPTTDGTFGTIGQGGLQVIDSNGNLVNTIENKTFLNGPWDLAIDDDGTHASIFVSTVNTGTVTRLDVSVGGPKGIAVKKMTTIATGYTVVPNGAALILGPTGLAYDEHSDTLYVASTADNAIFAITDAEHSQSSVDRGHLVFADAHLRGPLALRFAPNGNLLTANGDAVNADPEHPSEIVEFTPSGTFVRQYNVDAGQGGAFGLDTVLGDPNAPFNYAAVDDVTNSLTVVRIPLF
jgi:hypothetical protein